MKLQTAELERAAFAVISKQRDESALPEVVTAETLYAGTIQRLRPFFEDLLWDGLTMLVARPKAGKSWLTLQLAIAAAGGPRVDGVTALETGDVLYFALEEPQARTMARLREICISGDWARRIHFVYDLLPLMGGGAEQIEALVKKIKPRVVIVDTLTAALKGGGGKTSSDVFRSQYAEVARLRQVAEALSVAIILVHHVRKGGSDSAIEAVAGTGGIAAAVDTLWLLKRKPEGEGTLEIVGRESEERTLALKFCNDPFGWAVLGDDAALLLSADRREVLDLLREDGPVTPAQIAAALGKSQPSVRMMLKRMRADGQVAKRDGKYHIPTLSVSYGVTREREER